MRYDLKPAAAAACGLAFTIAVVRYPEVAFDASVRGLQLWFEVVLPALFPFFALAEVLMGLGVIHAFGVLLEPLMRPLFRIPGTGAFAVAMGLVSGYPLGAKIGGRLRRDGLCSQLEAERLISFANTADPLFMSGAVAVGMFALPQLGVTLTVAHYAAVVLVGFLMRFHGRGAMGPTQIPAGGGIWARALSALVEARRRDGRPIGQLFADAVREAMASLLFIGGCIMMFSVAIRVITVVGVTGAIATPLGRLLGPLGVDARLVDALISGTVEITLGAQLAAAAAAPLPLKAAAASAIIAWSGLSVHAQVAAMIHGTDVRLGPYVVARFLHAVLAAAITALLIGPAQPLAVALVQPAQAAIAAWEALPWGARWLSGLLWLIGVMGTGSLAGWAASALMRRRSA